jgi:Ala-tRNA(Pro) deacylase
MGHLKQQEVAMLARRFMEFLDTQKVRYGVIPHTTAYTSVETATRSHVPRNEIAKTVIVSLDGVLTMTVLPASRHVNLEALRVATGAERARIASESEFKRRFPDCEIGAMPPFGNLYGMTVLVDKALTHDKEIAFNACSHDELVRMSYEDFARVVKPKVLEFTAEGAHAVVLDDRLW